VRHCLFSVAVLCSATGIACAAEVTLVKYDTAKKELTVKDGQAEKTYKLSDKTKVTFEDRDGNKKEGTLAAAEKALGFPAARGKLKFDITADKEAVTALTLKMTRPGKN
jgi:hypothetical protein